jgi:hypothetical protein
VTDGKVNWGTVRKLIEDETGPIRAAEDISDGRNSEISVIVHADDGPVFVKGRKADHPQAWTQARETAINPSVVHISPWLKWSTRDIEWDLLGFEYIVGRRVDYAPGSPDLPMVTYTLLELQQISCPDIELKRAEQRWSAYSDSPELFMGDYLLHTDWSPGNVLVNGRAYLVDWAWPTKGAGFIDPVCLAVWLIASGHQPQSAESVIARIPSWQNAPRRGIDGFVRVQARMWADIAADSPYSWTADLARAAQLWVRYRQMRSHDSGDMRR